MQMQAERQIKAANNRNIALSGLAGLGGAAVQNWHWPVSVPLGISELTKRKIAAFDWDRAFDLNYLAEFARREW